MRPALNRSVRTGRAGFHPGCDQRAGLLLRAGSGPPAVAGRPGPTDQMVVADMRDEFLGLAAAVARRAFDLFADLGDGLAFPGHFTRRQMPDRIARHPAGIEVGALVACLLYTSPSPRDGLLSRMPSSA